MEIRGRVIIIAFDSPKTRATCVRAHAATARGCSRFGNAADECFPEAAEDMVVGGTRANAGKYKVRAEVVVAEGVAV